MDDPEIEFNQLWGSPQGVSDRRDFKAIQPLDWGTLLGKKRRVAACRNNLVDENLREARREVLLEARRCLLDLTNANAQLAQLEH
ncbi:MAG: transporter, partial [Alloprevotella sp.]